MACPVSCGWRQTSGCLHGGNLRGRGERQSRVSRVGCGSVDGDDGDGVVADVGDLGGVCLGVGGDAEGRFADGDGRDHGVVGGVHDPDADQRWRRVQGLGLSREITQGSGLIRSAVLKQINALVEEGELIPWSRIAAARIHRVKAEYIGAAPCRPTTPGRCCGWVTLGERKEATCRRSIGSIATHG